jgi:hypothetical protein
MKRSILAAVASMSLAAGGGAYAQGSPGEPGAGGAQGQTGAEVAPGAKSTTEANKHLGEIDVYLKDAENNTKALYQTAQASPGRLDTTLEKEALNNIDKAISSALTHVQHVKSLPEAKVSDTQRLDRLQRDLERAKTIASQLRHQIAAGDRAAVSAQASSLFAQLRAADDGFGQIADEQNLVRLDRVTMPERQPVGGGEANPPAEEAKPGAEKSTEPGMQVPKEPGMQVPKEPGVQVPKEPGTQIPKEQGTQNPSGGY